MNKKHFYRSIFLVLCILILGLTACAQFNAQSTTQFAVNLERKISGLEKKQMILSTGEKIVYLEAGDPKHETIVLLHGFGANKDNFTRFSRKLTDKYHVIIPDNVGFGESSRIDNARYDSDAQATRLHQMMSQLHLQQVHLGGSSMGGHISIAFAAKYPNQVKSLLLLDSGGFWSVPRMPIFTDFGTGKNPLIIENEEDYIKLYDIVMTNPPFVPKLMLRTFAQDSINNAVLERKISSQLAADPIEERAKTVKQPTLVIWGKEDKLLDVKTTTTIKALMPQSQVIILDDTGHLPMLEAPNKVAQDYLLFLANLK